MSRIAPSLDVTLVLQHVANADGDSVLDRARQPPLMRRGRMQSLVLVYRWPQKVVQQLASRYACISLQHKYLGTRVSTINLNHRQAMLDMMMHLRKLGHQRTGFVGRCGDLSWSRARFAGYVDSLCQFDLEYDPRRVIRRPRRDAGGVQRDGRGRGPDGALSNHGKPHSGGVGEFPDAPRGKSLTAEAAHCPIRRGCWSADLIIGIGVRPAGGAGTRIVA